MARLQVHRGLDSLPTAVAALLRFAPGRDFFSSLEWFRCLAGEGLESPGDIAVCSMANQAGQILAALPCRFRADGRLDGLTSFYTLRYAPATAENADSAEVAAQLALALWEHRPPKAVVDLRYLRSDAPLTKALCTSLGNAGFTVDPYFQYVNRHAPVPPGDFDAYFDARPSRLRNTCQRKRQQAARLHGLDSRVLTDPGPELEAGIEAFQRIYSLSWKGPEPRPGFMPALIRLGCQLGIGRLGLLSLDGTPAATQFWLTSGSVATIYKLAYDPSFATLSVGTLLTADMFRHAIDRDRVAEVDFGLGDEPYKLDWVDQSRDVIGLEAVNPSTGRGRSLLARRGLRNALRRMGLRPHRPVRWPAPR